MGELTGFAKITRDLTERRRARGGAAHQRGALRLLVDSVRDYAIFMLDPDGIVQSWNAGAQRSRATRPDEIIGRHFRAFYTPEDQAAGQAGTGSWRRRARRAARGRGLARAQGRHPVLGQRGGHRGVRRRRRPARLRQGHARHERAPAAGGAGALQPAHERIPGHAGARAAQSARADPQRRDHHAAGDAVQPGAAQLPRRDRPPAHARDAAGGRPAGRGALTTGKIKLRKELVRLGDVVAAASRSPGRSSRRAGTRSPSSSPTSPCTCRAIPPGCPRCCRTCW